MGSVRTQAAQNFNEPHLAPAITSPFTAGASNVKIGESGKLSQWKMVRPSAAILDRRSGFEGFWGWAKAGKGRERRRRGRLVTGRIGRTGYYRGGGGKAKSQVPEVRREWLVDGSTVVWGMDPGTGNVWIAEVDGRKVWKD